MKNSITHHALSLLAITVFATGCDMELDWGTGLGGGDVYVPTPTLEITPYIYGLRVGDTQRLSAVARRADGSRDPAAPITWSLADETIARVDNTGQIVGLLPGSTAVFASAPGYGFATAIANVEIGDAPIALGVTFTATALGWQNACALTGSGSVYCWGSRSDVGGGERWSATRVVSAQMLRGLVGGGAHACALDAEGRAYCWGNNWQGQLGIGNYESKGAPVAVIGSGTFKRLYAGSGTTCGLTLTNHAQCWGNNSSGQFGNGGHGNMWAPVDAASGREWSMLAVGNEHVCGLDAEGRLLCSGSNNLGQLGDGTYTTRSTPTAVNASVLFDAVAAGAVHTCALAEDETVFCWGSIFGLERAEPTQMGTDRFASIASGWGHVCALTSAGAAYCGGSNFTGQLGIGSRNDTQTLVPVAGGHSFRELFAGPNDTCGITTDGVAYCWGNNEHGQIGDGTREPRLTPTRVAGQ